MASDSFEFISREELLGGLPARRASTLMFAIESRTAHQMLRSRRAMAEFLTERTAETRERAFFDAVARGRDLPLHPSIQDIERYAPTWAPLVPADSRVRATLAHMLGDKYEMLRRRTVAVQQALGLDDDAVRESFQRLHDRPIDSIFATSIPWRERLRWIRAEGSKRLEGLPPFWTAFALTLTETVGAGILALPIAFAEIGPLAGVVAIVVLGLVNILTIGAMSEAVARNGNVRYGNAYFGRLVADYLGRTGTAVLTPALVILNVITLLAYYVGLSTTLGAATGIPAVVWVGVAFVVGVVILRRDSLDATVASALVTGAASIGIVILLSLVTFRHVTGDNLRHAEIPFVDGQPFEAAILELIFGVVLLAFFGHTSAANCAAVVLRQDPSARSLISGSMAALGAALVLYCIWIVAVNGAVGTADLVGESGTALVPLADKAGPSVVVLGSLFAIVSMGMASVHISLGLYNQVKEWLPSRPPAAENPLGFSSLGARVLSHKGQFWIGIAPVAAIALLVEWLLLSDRESFAGPLGFLGVIAAPVVAGIFSILMLCASRRKGDCEVGMAWRFLGHPVVVVATFVLFFACLLAHGLVIWEEPYKRISALLVAAVMVGVIVAAVRRGAFIGRAIVELRVDDDAQQQVAVGVVANGERADADVRLTARASRLSRSLNDGVMTAANLGSAVVELPQSRARELKVWAHRLTDDNASEGLAAHVKIADGQCARTFDLEPAAGHLIVAFAGTPTRVEISFPNGGLPDRRTS